MNSVIVIFCVYNFIRAVNGDSCFVRLIFVSHSCSVNVRIRAAPIRDNIFCFWVLINFSLGAIEAIYKNKINIPPKNTNMRVNPYQYIFKEQDISKAKAPV